MKIAVIGKTERAKAWEKHLRKLSAVKEVILSPSLIEDNIDGCILLDDSINKLHLLFDSIRLGYHSYLVAHLPTDTEMVEKIYHASEEAKVTVQFSHWPGFSPASLWVRQQIPKPDLIQIKKELSNAPHSCDPHYFEQQWMDELAFIIKFQQSGIQHIITRPIEIEESRLGLELSLRFDDGSAASLQFSNVGRTDYHQRIISSGHMMIDCEVNLQKARKIEIVGKKIIRSDKSFDASKTVELSVLNFIKAIRQNRASDFSAYDALKTVKALEKIRAALDRF